MSEYFNCTLLRLVLLYDYVKAFLILDNDSDDGPGPDGPDGPDGGDHDRASRVDKSRQGCFGLSDVLTHIALVSKFYIYIYYYFSLAVSEKERLRKQFMEINDEFLKAQEENRRVAALRRGMFKQDGPKVM